MTTSTEQTAQGGPQGPLPPLPGDAYPDGAVDLEVAVLAPPSYDELPMPPQVALTFYVCGGCSAVVWRPSLHTPTCAGRVPEPEPDDEQDDPRRVKQPAKDPRRKDGVRV